ncbi:MAG: hypothetical protein RIF33_02280 [Cyclobacteriaceae bacterium]
MSALNYTDPFTPVDPDFSEIVRDTQKAVKSGKVHFFNPADQVDDTSGHVINLEKSRRGEFLVLNTGMKVRLDKVITLFGRPGPAYDRYDAFANACLACEDLGQFY